jgi:hypothetical protein
MNDGNVITTQFNTSSSIQPVILDHYDIPPPLDNPSYTDLQSYSTDVIFEEPPIDNPSYTDLQSYSTDPIFEQPRLDNPSYTDLQSCSTDVIFEEPEYIQQTTSSCEQETNQTNRTNSFNKVKI